MKITFQRFDREKMAAEALLSGNRLSDEQRMKNGQ